jgi:hypothetical protein
MITYDKAAGEHVVSGSPLERSRRVDREMLGSR